MEDGSRLTSQDSFNVMLLLSFAQSLPFFIPSSASASLATIVQMLPFAQWKGWAKM